jgi:hypothetical protein
MQILYPKSFHIKYLIFIKKPPLLRQPPDPDSLILCRGLKPPVAIAYIPPPQQRGFRPLTKNTTTTNIIINTLPASNI